MMTQNEQLVLNGVDCSLVRDVDTIQEFTQILLCKHTGLVDESGRERDLLDIIALYDNVILLASLDCHTLKHRNLTGILLSQEVTEVDPLTLFIGNHVDGEMGIHGTHCVLKAIGNTLNHVADVGAHCTDDSDFLAALEVGIDTNGFGADFAELNPHVLEGTLESSALAGHSDNTALDIHIDIVGDVQKSGGLYVLHLRLCSLGLFFHSLSFFT